MGKTSSVFLLTGVVLVLFVSSLESREVCEFHDFLANCQLTVGGLYPSQITAVVNHCNEPVDVAVNIKADAQKVSWSHTFVNHHEMQRIMGFPRTVLLHVFLYQIKEKHSVHIQVDGPDSEYSVNFWPQGIAGPLVEIKQFLAVFHVDGRADPFFLNSTVHISKATSCGVLNGAAGLTTLVIFIIIILCLFIVIPTIIWYKRRQHVRMRNALVENMEPPSRTPPSSIEMRPTPLGAIEENIPGETQAEHEEVAPSSSTNSSVPSTSHRDVIGREQSFDLTNGTLLNTMSNGYV